ncbi:nucleotide-binding protein [Methanoplanus sp. FWC-SCC4]|uniref:Nucleotide-binding protein n=1 Tax=Methanochimaera problematica TaxID=2609417 RepID=A0AA97I350_9EURY|nr:nucleotide-binding protein [Methanoplanus sp. FWC-SCC4]WOF16980.1 nucleotide-binding protein [Methanoplanus sp. FWC-SCC4]
MTTRILDSSFFFLDIPIDGECMIPARVEDELIDIRAKARLEAMKAKGMRVSEPSRESLERARKAALKSGDITVLSETDLDVVALALDTGGDVVSDDFAVSNTAQTLGLRVIPLQQRAARKIRWRYRCQGCGKYYSKPGTCEICGAEIKRKLK